MNVPSKEKKTFWEKEKMLVLRIFSFSQHVYQSLHSHGCQKSGFCTKGFKDETMFVKHLKDYFVQNFTPNIGYKYTASNMKYHSLLIFRVLRGSVVTRFTQSLETPRMSHTGSSGLFRGSVFGQLTLHSPNLVLVKPRTNM